MNKRPVHYTQIDPRWAGKLYDIDLSNGPDYMKTTGCGPTAAAMVVAQLYDPKVTPPDMADFSIKHGDRTASNGTAWTLMDHVAAEYGSKYTRASVQAHAKKCLDEGGLVVVIVGKSRWTGGGHFIVWWGYDSHNAFINDPSGDTAKRNTGTLEELHAARRCYFCFWPKMKKEEDDPMANIIEQVRKQTGATDDQIAAALATLVRLGNHTEETWEKQGSQYLKDAGLIEKPRPGNEPVEFGELGLILQRFEQKISK